MNIDNCFLNNKFTINITDKYIHIINYENIENICNDNIIVILNNKQINVYGNSLLVKRMDKYEIVITGSIEKVMINGK